MKKILLCFIFALAVMVPLTAAKQPNPLNPGSAVKISSGPAYAGSSPESARIPFGTTEDLLKEKLALLPYLSGRKSLLPAKSQGKVAIPVLNYHSVSDVPVGIGILSVTADNFDKQMKYLMDNGYTPIHLNDNPIYYEKPVIITFDDGYADNYHVAYPILEKYNFKATIFVITGAVDTPGYLTSGQIKSMPLVSFQSHTVSHRQLTELSEEQLLSELWESQIFLSRLTGKQAFALCYPYGKYNNQVIALTSRYYRCAMTTQSGIETTILGNYRILRPFVSRNDTLSDFMTDLNVR